MMELGEYFCIYCEEQLEPDEYVGKSKKSYYSQIISHLAEHAIKLKELEKELKEHPWYLVQK